MKNKQAGNIRLENVSIEFLNKEVDSTAINVLVECLEEIAGNFSEPTSKKQRGMRKNENIRKNTK